jgi:hypothetical protein
MMLSGLVIGPVTAPMMTSVVCRLLTLIQSAGPVCTGSRLGTALPTAPATAVVYTDAQPIDM